MKSKDGEAIVTYEFSDKILGVREVIRGQYENYRHHSYIEPHRRSYYVFFFIKTGFIRHSIDFKMYHSKQRSIFFMIPRQVYLVETARNISGITVTFPPEMLTNEEMISPVIQNLSDNNQINLSNQEYNYLDHLLSAMLKEYGDKEMFSQALLKNYLNNLLLYSGRVYARQNRLQQAAGDNNEMIKKFIRLLSLNWNRSMNVSQYARELYITPGHLNHIVKKQTGRKAGDWIKEKKLVEIKRLLIHSRYSIKEIADKSGFEDPAYFNRYFKNNVGETPLSFREEILKKYNS